MAALNAGKHLYCEWPLAATTEQAQQMANELAHGPTRAYGGVKRLLHGAATNPLCEQMELENESPADTARSADAQEGLKAFLAKRPPQFSGR
jgi:2-(1,2-epoxy-1,2-dihydrophenyl)acetyl-CoA isomerase